MFSLDGSRKLIAGDKKFWGFSEGVGSEARFNGIEDFVVTKRRTIIVYDKGNNLFREIDTNGENRIIQIPLEKWVIPGVKFKDPGITKPRAPEQLAIDKATDELYFVDGFFCAVYKYNLTLKTITKLFNFPPQDTIIDEKGFFKPKQILINSKHELIVLGNGLIAKLSNGSLNIICGKIDELDHRDGIKLDARIESNSIIAIGPNDQIFIVESRAIRAVDNYGGIRTVIGDPKTAGCSE
jgi:hypothetical protein